MRKGILGSLTALLAGTGLVIADPPAIPDSAAVAANGASQPSAVLANPAAPSAEAPHSPYWPDPLGKLQCIAPGCLTPQAPHEETGRTGQLVIWGGAEYLLWWVKNQPLAAPLVTTGTPPSVGALGPGTAVLIGGSDIDYHTFSGGRFTLGLGWGSNSDGLWGVEGSGFFTERRPFNTDAASSAMGAPLLARPFVNPLTGMESAFIVSDPGIASGSVAVGSDSAIYGWDVNLVRSFCSGGPLHVDWLGGFRYLNLSEELEVTQNTTILATTMLPANAFLPASNVFILDHFGTRNEFYGGQLGARVEYAGERIFLTGLFKIALGATHEVIGQQGSTSGSPAGGLLVLASNSGQRSHDEFAAVPEIGINVGYQFNPHFRAFVGYSFLYISDVVRPGDQVSPVINPALIPASTSFPKGVGPAEPTFSFHQTDFWAQGVNFGLEFRF